jgi:hypothetical protein
MVIKTVAFLSFVMISDVPFACEPSIGRPCLSKADATKLQEKYLAEQKFDQKAFTGPSVSHNCFEQGCFWSFIYIGVEPMPGNHFMLVVHDPSGTIELVPGL